jgi:hypothetical protein
MPQKPSKADRKSGSLKSNSGHFSALPDQENADYQAVGRWMKLADKVLISNKPEPNYKPDPPLARRLEKAKARATNG